MKSVAFNYARPDSVAEAARMLAADPGARVLAGGQTLGPMLNLRLAQPALLVDITRIRELAAVTEDTSAVTIGATVTHAAIEDGRIPDPTGGFLRQVARGIAYRAVRNRGTVGGSLAHADPAADWLSCLSALGADVVVGGGGGIRRMPLAAFVRGAMETQLAAGELLAAVSVPKFSRAARFGFHKICRKTGEFADAIGVAVHDPDRQLLTLAASTGVGPPVVIDARDLHLDRGQPPDTDALQRRLVQAGLVGDAYDLKLRAVAVRRAIAQMQTARVLPT
jgi:carbon-monoxide dehydrogenase medium subunit